MDIFWQQSVMVLNIAGGFSHGKTMNANSQQ
jgi:hypothetical protein